MPQNPLKRPDVFVLIWNPSIPAVVWKTGTRGFLEALVDQKLSLRQDGRRQGITPKVVL